MEKIRSLREVFDLPPKLNEEDYGNIGAGGYGYGSDLYGGAGAGGYGGMGGVGGKSVLSVFGDPLGDVAKTAVGAAKEFGVNLKGLTRTALEAAISLVLPFVAGSYKKIAEQTSEELGKVKKEYEPVYKKNLDAIFNKDLLTLGFFLNPAAVVSSAAFERFMYHSPDAAVGILGFFVPEGGRKLWDSLTKQLDPARVQRILKTTTGLDHKTRLIVWDDRNRRKLYSNVRRAMGIESDPHDPDSNQLESRAWGLSFLKEAEDASGMTYPQVVKGLLRDPAIQNAITSSGATKTLHSQGEKILNRRLLSFLQVAQRIASAKSPSELGADQQGEVDPDSFAAAKKKGIESLAHYLDSDLESLRKDGVDPKSIGLENAYEKAKEKILGLTLNTSSVGPKMSPKGVQKTNVKTEPSQRGSSDIHDSGGERHPSTSGG